LTHATLDAEPDIHCTLEFADRLPWNLLDELKRNLVDLSEDD
jgi:hypothetical protein